MGDADGKVVKVEEGDIEGCLDIEGAPVARHHGGGDLCPLPFCVAFPLLLHFFFVLPFFPLDFFLTVPPLPLPLPLPLLLPLPPVFKIEFICVMTLLPIETEDEMPPDSVRPFCFSLSLFLLRFTAILSRDDATATKQNIQMQ